MTEFVEEVRSRVVRLLRMANTTDDRLRKQIVAYADATPEPPIMGSLGIGTTGCPLCRRTMWQQRDSEGPVWVCAFCGHVEGVTVCCPHCEVAMRPPARGWTDRWSCPECPRVAATGESAQEIESRERGRQRALGLLDHALTLREPKREARGGT
jgi:DNA-directed RNA polymerase subunit M/transcription elongation factor TFIIS